MKQPKRGRAALRLRLLANVLRFVHDEYYRKLLVDALRTYFRLSPEEEQELLASPEYAEVEEMYFDTVIGRAEAAAEQRGRQESLRSALKAVIEARFAPVPRDIEERIQRLEDRTAPNALLRRAATAKSLDEVWAAPVH